MTKLIYHDVKNTFMEIDLPEYGGIIGYAPENSLVIDAIGVSAKHARLSVKEDNLFIEDLQSLNGTYINKTLITGKTMLQNGDFVQIGVFQLRFNVEYDTWSIFAENPKNSVFVEDKYETAASPADSMDFSTAITVIASRNIKETIEFEDDATAFQIHNDSQGLNQALSKKYSLEDIRETEKYKIIKQIGKGGMGTVFLARQKVLNLYRALKVMPLSVREEFPDSFERFIQEARIASCIRHPNIVGVMDVEIDAEQGISYIVMEFVDGGDLRRILKSQVKLSEIQALLIARSVAFALKNIHERNIVHRDIKPDNIMFTRNGEVKLADLGIAKNYNDDVNITRSDAMIGTPAYLSPEQIENPMAVDIRSDIYSLGATLYEMLTGTTPYTGKNTYDIVHKMLSESIPNPRLKNPEISSITAKIIMKMLQKEPKKRYQTPQMLIDVLDRILPRLSDCDVQKIIQSAVLGIELPERYNSMFLVGIGPLVRFLFYNVMQKVITSFYKKKNNNYMRSDDCHEITFSIKIKEKNLPVSNFAIMLKTEANQKLSLTSSTNESVTLASDNNGYIKVDDMAHGEYILSTLK